MVADHQILQPTLFGGKSHLLKRIYTIAPVTMTVNDCGDIFWLDHISQLAGYSFLKNCCFFSLKRLYNTEFYRCKNGIFCSIALISVPFGGCIPCLHKFITAGSLK